MKRKILRTYKKVEKLKVVEELLKVIKCCNQKCKFRIAAFCFIEIKTSKLLKELVLIPPHPEQSRRAGVRELNASQKGICHNALKQYRFLLPHSLTDHRQYAQAI